MIILSKLRVWAKDLKRSALTVYYVARNSKTPLLVKMLALIIAAYAFSPIDLIPDFIPVLGLLDDLILIPLGLALVVRLTPELVIIEARRQALTATEKPVSLFAAICIVVIWLALALALLRWLFGG